MITIKPRKCRAAQAFARGDEQVAPDVSFWWLGQAGFLLRYQGLMVVVDPYLSDCLVRKYAHSRFKHERLMQAPMLAWDMKPLHWILCTHRHSDHMDPETLPVLLQSNPRCRIITPAAETDHLEEIGLNRDKLVLVQEGDHLQLGPDASVEVIASAHEELKTNEKGRRPLPWLCASPGRCFHLSLG